VIIRIDGKDYTVFTSWSDITYSHFCDIVKYSDAGIVERLNAYTRLPDDIINKLTVKQLEAVAGMVAWMDEYENCLLFVKGYEDDLSIGERTYGELETCKAYLKDKPLLALGKLVEVYYGENIKDVLAIDAMGRGLSVLTKIDLFLKKFPELYEYEPTAEEVEAGVEDFNKVGSFYTVKKLAEKHSKHPDEILQWQALIVYRFLQTDAIEARVNRNLLKIYSRKK